MSIKSELEKTAENLRRTRKAILDRGGNITATAGLKDLPEAILNIPADTSLAFLIDEETAYEKTVPENAEEYALLKSVGGMSYKCNNLFDKNAPYTPSWHLNPETGEERSWGVAWGVTDYIAVIENSTYTANRSFGNSADVNHACIAFYDKDKNYIGFAGKVSTFTAPSDCAYIRSNLIISEIDTAMLNEGSTALPYEPYFEGLRHTKVTAFESDGANLFDIYRTDFVAAKTSGLNFLPKAENGVMYSGGKSGVEAGAMIPIYIKPNTNYTFSCNIYWNTDKETRAIISINLISNIQDSTYSTVKVVKSIQEQGYYSHTFNSGEYEAFGIIAYSTNQYGIEFREVQLVESSTALPYKPYVGKIDTYTIPEAVQSFEGYGEGNPDNSAEHNYIDFGNRKYIALGHIVDGAWQSYEAPIETDISDILPYNAFIKVEGGGVIRASNEHKQAAPSEIKYTVKVGY